MSCYTSNCIYVDYPILGSQHKTLVHSAALTYGLSSKLSYYLHIHVQPHFFFIVNNSSMKTIYTHVCIRTQKLLAENPNYWVSFMYVHFCPFCVQYLHTLLWAPTYESIYLCSCANAYIHCCGRVHMVAQINKARCIHIRCQRMFGTYSVVGILE